jgi:phosphoribosylformimino-5-aminoimidazole carboxamide ribotide isomerase
MSKPRQTDTTNPWSTLHWVAAAGCTLVTGLFVRHAWQRFHRRSPTSSSSSSSSMSAKSGQDSKTHTNSVITFRPCIDLRNGKVTQIIGSTLQDTGSVSTTTTASTSTAETNFETDRNSSFYAELFQKHKLSGGHVIMLGPGNTDAALEACRSFPGGLQVGGGINPDNATMYLDAGASHVIVTSYVFRNGQIDWERLQNLCQVVGKDRLVLDLSCRRKAGDNKSDGAFYVVTDRWQRYTDVQVNQETMQQLASYCDEFLVHGVDVEGKRQGVEQDLVRLLGEHCPIPVTYAGGVRGLDDISLVRSLGNGKVDITVGSALDIYGGDLAFTDVLDACHR